MTNPNDLAFPSPEDAANHGYTRGLTKREYFAGLAMQAIANCQRHITRFGIPVEAVVKDMDDYPPSSYAKVAVAMADALIAELSKEVK